MKRRQFLNALLAQSALARSASPVGVWRPSPVLRGAALIGAGGTAWAAGHGAARAQSSASTPANKLVVVLLRGAVDGLSVVTPFAERGYYDARSSIALAAPGSGEGALLPLDPQFGLHPALSRLHRFWNQGQLGFIHASGSPDPTRSHFDAQEYMETGTPGRKSTPDGWMNRLLAQMPGPAAATRAVNMGTTPARIFAGGATVASLGLGPRAFEAKAIDAPDMQAALAKLYGRDGALGRTFQETAEGRREITRSMAAAGAQEHGQSAGGDNGRSSDPSADNGAPTARGFAADARRLGHLIQADPHTQLAFTSVGGWDTHVNQGGARGQLANRLASLGEGLESLIQGLGEAYARTVIVVMSEFGRTVRQNGTGGTDHGRGNVMWLLGAPVAGGRVLGDWPGLERSALQDGRDLAVTTDFRAVLAPVLQGHLAVSDSALSTVFPGYTGGALKAGLLKA